MKSLVCIFNRSFSTIRCWLQVGPQIPILCHFINLVLVIMPLGWLGFHKKYPSFPLGLLPYTVILAVIPPCLVHLFLNASSKSSNRPPNERYA